MTTSKVTKIAIFRQRKIRKVIYKNEWWFSVVDVIATLTDSVKPRDYWFRMKLRVKDSEGFELSTICRQLKLIASDGKKYSTDCSNTEGIFRIIQSVPSPKAEPFKRWLAKVGYERIEEIEDPEILFSQLGEATTTEITKTEHPQGFSENKQTSKRGGRIAGEAREKLEKETGRSIKSSQNYFLL